MSAFSELSVTTSAGTTTVKLGNGNSITLDSPAGASGPAASIRSSRTFKGFKQYGPNRVGIPLGELASEKVEGIYPATKRVSALSYAGGVITVTEAGTPQADQPAWPDDPWTTTTDVTVDDSSELVVAGGGIAANQKIPLAGISAISLTEAG